MKAIGTFLAITLVGAAAIAAPGTRWLQEVGGRIERGAGGATVVLRESWVGDGQLAGLGGVPSLTTLDLAHTRISDLGLRQLRTLTTVRDLDLSWAELIGDEGVVSIKELTSLRRLSLRGTQVTSATLAALSGLTELESLDVAFARITDEGMPSLLRLRKLRALSLGGNRISDVGLTVLRALPALETLDLAGRQRTDSGLWSVELGADGLRALAAVRGLRTLSVAGSGLSDDDVGVLASLVALERLDLRGCSGVGDGAVDALGRLPRLVHISLAGTRVTPAGRARLRAALSRVTIAFDEPGR